MDCSGLLIVRRKQRRERLHGDKYGRFRSQFHFVRLVNLRIWRTFVCGHQQLHQRPLNRVARVLRKGKTEKLLRVLCLSPDGTRNQDWSSFSTRHVNLCHCHKKDFVFDKADGCYLQCESLLEPNHRFLYNKLKKLACHCHFLRSCIA